MRGPATEHRPRAIVAKFERYCDRECIREAGVCLNKQKTGIYVNEQFPPDMESRRRRLFPVFKRFKSDPNVKAKVSLVRDKLYVGNKTYNPDTEQLELPKPKIQSMVEDNLEFNIRS